MVSIVMVGEGPPSTSYGPGCNKDVDADLRRHDVGRLPQVNTQGRWYHTGSGAAFIRSMLKRLLTLRSGTAAISLR
jgi:hypothetical protein